MEIQELLNNLVDESKNISGDNLTGIYLHGSVAMGCFHVKKSDIDFIVVVKKELSKKIKRKYMDMLIELNQKAPKKGIEMSIVKEEVCNPFIYPTPFELHFSIEHLKWYLSNPDDYIEKMNGTDRDLAAHFTVIYHRGKVLYGKKIETVFAKVNSEDYMDSIWLDIENSKDEIIDNTMYIVLNLCRVLAYKEENLILSKQEAGEWAMQIFPASEYKKIVSDMLKEYETGETIQMKSAYMRGTKHKIFPNLLNQNFHCTEPNLIWCTDFTYIRIGNGKMRYNCSIIDLYDCSVVATLNSDYINTELAKATLEKALTAENSAEGLILHSDQGYQFTSWDFIHYCKSKGIYQSMSKAGCPYDNAPMERFYNTLKNELIYPNYFYDAASLDQAVKRYVYVWYNHVRPHSYNHWKTPFEARYDG